MGCKVMSCFVSDSRKKNGNYRILYLFCSFIMIFFFICCPLSQCRKASYIPEAPHGPDYGFCDFEYEYKIFSINTDAYWRFCWDDGLSTSWLQLDDGQSYISATHSWNTPGTYKVQVQFKNEFAPNGIWSQPLSVSIYDKTNNVPPQKPTIESDTQQGCVFVEFSFFSCSEDTDGDNVQYRYRWNNHNTSNWTSFFASDTSVLITHTWKKAYTYSVICQAKDEHNLLSEWSDPLFISIFPDEDRDMLSDPLERSLGSDQSDPNDILTFKINTNRYYILKTKNNDLLYDMTNRNVFPILLTSKGYYSIDLDQDEVMDYFYYPQQDTVVAATISTEPSQMAVGIFHMLLFFVLVGLVLSIFLLLMKFGIICVYKEVIVEKS